MLKDQINLREKGLKVLEKNSRSTSLLEKIVKFFIAHEDSYFIRW